MAMLLILLRGTALSAGLSGFGSLLFGLLFNRLFIGAAPQRARLDQLIRASLVAAVLLTLAWLVVASAVIAGAETRADLIDALPIVAMDTRFGHLVLLRLGLLIAASLLSARFRAGSVVIMALALALQGGIGHAGARGDGEGTMLMVSEALHLLAAGAWLGGLPPLLIGVARLPTASAARLSRAFSPMAFACVLLVAGTGLCQAADLIGGFRPLVDNPYGRMALAKLSLFAALLTLACLNRFAFTTQLLGDSPRRARRRLCGSLVIEIVLGLAVVLAAARLASLAPPTDV